MANEHHDAWPAAGFAPERPAGSRADLGKSLFYSRYGKRAADLFMSMVGLGALAIPMAAVALAIYLLNGRPVFFRQKRVGRHGRLFTIYKFRTMTTAACESSTITAANDDRVTVLGRWLRRFKLDELPQLWNVLRGEMSFVGPRPDVAGYLDRLSGDAKVLWELRPGITGPATLLFKREEEILASITDYVRFNDEVIYPEKVKLNLAYLRQCSFVRDLGYIVATLAPRLSRGLGVDKRLGLDHRALESRMSEAAARYS